MQKIKSSLYIYISAFTLLNKGCLKSGFKNYIKFSFVPIFHQTQKFFKKKKKKKM